MKKSPIDSVLRPLLSEGFAALGQGVSDTQIDQLCAYCALLLERNRVMNLTAITDPEEVCRLHFFDSAALLGCAELTGASLIDVGTGAGFPGLVLKILVPDLRLTLLDGLQKRLDFLEEVCGELRLDGVTFLHARAEEGSLLPEHRDGYDFAAARAVARLRTLTELCLPYVRPGGQFLAMKAEEYTAEAAEAGERISVLGGRLLPGFSYQIPGAAVTRQVAVIEKLTPTPSGYPRRWKRIQREM